MRRNIAIVTVLSIITILVCCFGTYMYITNFVLLGDLTGLRYQILEGRDSFYLGAGEFDSDRIPLIKPYELIRMRPAHEYGWILRFDLSYANNPIQIDNVKDVRLIAVENEIVMVYSPFLDIHEERTGVDESWFMFNPEDETQEGFELESDFLDFVKSYDIHNPEWLSPDDAFKIFTRTECLPWIPGCK
jgi:hypothetical protein